MNEKVASHLPIHFAFFLFPFLTEFELPLLKRRTLKSNPVIPIEGICFLIERSFEKPFISTSFYLPPVISLLSFAENRPGTDAQNDDRNERQRFHQRHHTPEVVPRRCDI